MDSLYDRPRAPARLPEPVTDPIISGRSASGDITIVKGTNDKPVASTALVEVLANSELDGQLFIGYPIIGSADGKYAIDALYLSPLRGLVVLDLVDGTSVNGHEQRQDDAATKLQSRLLAYRDLVERRQLRIPITALTFAPGLANLPDIPGYPVANRETVVAELDAIEWTAPSDEIFQRTLSAIQNISTIRRSTSGRSIANEESRGAKLKRLEDSIATLDNLQGKAVIETVEGVQRIRGLAGSGKTIVLALKAAYLHAQHPEWRMAVTFNTRSLKGHFTRLINNFSVEQTGEEPNWDHVRVVNAWGAGGGLEREGIYHEYCVRHGVEYLDFSTAARRYGRDDAFKGACAEALRHQANADAYYDAILVDEAQDFPPEFLRLCYGMLERPKRLVYAYDELQNLAGAGLPPADEIFGTDDNGNTLVSFDSGSDPSAARRDIILEKCYRNSRPVLVTAHGLGFGTAREPSKQGGTGLVQMFDEPSLWSDIGYRVKSGDLSPGREVVLARTSETSPRFLEEHSPLDDLVVFDSFEDQSQQAEWVAEQIVKNLGEDELRHDDIVVINTNPLSTRKKLGVVRKALLDRGVMSHLAGVETSADVFFRPDLESVTFTGVFRAKGNEAAMVYIVNVDECDGDGANLAQLRNRLFTAITRSKAWVRVLGIGPGMDRIRQEYRRVRKENFELDFRYPTAGELAELKIVHRDMSPEEQGELRKQRSFLEDLVSGLESGTVFTEDLDDDLLARLRQFLDRDAQ